MTGRFRTLIRPYSLIRLTVIPILALLALLVTGDTGQGAAPAPCKCFVPINSSTWSSTDPGSSPDIAGTLNFGLGANNAYDAGQGDDTGDYNFGGVVGVAPPGSVPEDGQIPNGAFLGTVQSTATLALLNNPCTSRVEVPFQFMKGTNDIGNVVHMLPFGQGNELAIMAGDNPPFDGQQAVNPPPIVTQYPAFLNAIFDPDFVDYGNDKIPGNGDDNNGPQAPIKPRFRAVATTWLSFASLWVVLQSVWFEPGTDLPQLPVIPGEYGYPSVTVLQTSSAAGSATPPIAGAITDFCTPLAVTTQMPGVTGDNPATGGNEGGIPLRTLPAEVGTKIISVGYYLSQRDADGDGFENAMDPCPYNPDTEWNPRDPARAGDTDVFVGAPAPDGIPNTCDPSPDRPEGSQPTDHDNDTFPNAGDNCPLVPNPGQEDKDPVAGEEIGDGIGDACDQNPGSPDGAQIVCIKINAVEVGGPTTAGTTECLQELPAFAQAQAIAEEEVTSVEQGGGGAGGPAAAGGGGAGGAGAGGGAAGGAGGPASGVGSLSPVAGSVPAWAAIAAALGAAGLIGSLGTFASRLMNRRRDD